MLEVVACVCTVSYTVTGATAVRVVRFIVVEVLSPIRHTTPVPPARRHIATKPNPMYSVAMTQMCNAANVTTSLRI